MAEDLKLITLKMPVEEIQALQDFLTDNDLDNRSEVIRRAITSYIEGGAKAKKSDEGVFVHLNPVLLLAMQNMEKDGTIHDTESYIRALVEKDIVPAEVLQDSKVRSFRNAQTSFRNA